MCAEVVERVGRGQTVAVVSDAGTPGISDPGSRVVAAVVAAMSISARATERFVMEGFFPRRGAEREARLREWDREARTIVFYESPQRLGTTLVELAARYPARSVSVVRELTKIHEEVLRGPLGEVAAQVAAREVRGEVVVVLEGAAPVPEADESTLSAALLERLDEGASVRDAVDAVVDLFGVAHRPTYELALRLRARGES